MREELKQSIEPVYGLDEGDFDYFLDLVGRVAASHIARTQDEIAPIRDDPDAVEIVSDLAWYTHIDTLFLWEYALWRLQGILEGIISSKFLAGRKHLFGLRAKLDALKDEGYVISPEDEAELIEWARFRNALSHMPPEQYRPIWLEETDLKEYQALVKRVAVSLREQLEQRTEPGASEA